MGAVAEIVYTFLFSFHGALILPLYLFCFHLRFRKFGLLRLIACLVPYYFIPFLYTVWMDPAFLVTGNSLKTLWVAPFFAVGWYNFSYVIFFAAAMGIVLFCFQTTLTRVLFYGGSAYLVQNFIHCIGRVFSWFIFGANGINNAVMLCCRIVVLVVFYFGCVLRVRKEDSFKLNNVALVLFVLITLMVINVFNLWIGDLYFQGYDFINIQTSFSGMIMALLLLVVQFGFFDRSKLEQDKAVVENLLNEAERQRQSSQENIDLINMKCHDMKHQLALFRGVVGAAGQQEAIDELEKTISVYDSSANTGNETLDVVLMEKMLRCEKYGIRFTWLADGAALSFLSPADVYSLFGNALDNAIEAVGSEKEERRIILLRVARKDAFVSVTCENTCSVPLRFEGGLPQTTKEDKRYHGFGVKSIRYVAEKYGGTVAMRQADGKFYLSILFPQRD